MGANSGEFLVLERAAKIELVSSLPMTLDNASLVITQAGQNQNQIFIYSGFRLLTVNGGKYYLFKEIDPATCKPLKVYVIDADQYKHINLSAAESLSDKCQKNVKTNAPVVTPTVLQTVTP